MKRIFIKTVYDRSVVGNQALNAFSSEITGFYSPVPSSLVMTPFTSGIEPIMLCRNRALPGYLESIFYYRMSISPWCIHVGGHEDPGYPDPEA